MKKLSVLAYSLIIGLSSFAYSGTDINEKLLRNFKERFPNAEQIRWTELADNYIVNFMEDGVRTNIIYDKDGVFVRSTRYYFEQNLPYYLLVTIKKKYTDKKIFAVTEVSTAAGIEYFVKLEDARIWMTIRIDGEGNLGVVEKYRKA
ncbi:MAG: hypothetical protein Q8927_04860 [Bacteroidota bacterium]|nr:hypothetical protein [Bacteroidota bacterium]MDP4215509.1 hypothetical protein [Bacteroidota bacterium]MDP4247166.1 hypothetical protein [Bacteroidota bacterium]MDP4253082.1 hypothetical protein [Bacteroidota bacterium]MDP4259813.1 hypothetical protein [Bacteroidota bacterium]